MKVKELKKWTDNLPDEEEVKFHLVTSKWTTLVVEQGDDVRQSGWIERREPPEEEGG